MTKELQYVDRHWEKAKVYGGEAKVYGDARMLKELHSIKYNELMLSKKRKAEERIFNFDKYWIKAKKQLEAMRLINV